MNKITKLILFVLGGLLFSFTAVKAYLLSITWDEAYSYIGFIRRGYYYQGKLETMSANNHLLLTWLDIQFVKLFGVSEFVLRIPALLAHLLLLIYSAKLLSHLKNKWLIISGFLIINLNPYLLDFFSLARGYGLSIGLMMASIYYLYIFQQEFKNKFAIYSMLFGALSVLANFVLLNYFLGAFSCIFIIHALKAIDSIKTGAEKISFWKNIWKPAVVFVSLVAFVVPIAFDLRAAGALYFGRENGFWKDTVHTSMECWLYKMDYPNWIFKVIGAFIIATLVAAFVLVIVRFLKKQFTIHNSFLISILMICLFCAASTIAQHLLLGTLYLVDRTALFFTVLFPLVFVFLIHELTIKKVQAVFLSYAVLGFVVFHSVNALNMKYVFEWKPDADTKVMLSDLDKIKVVAPEKGNININIPLLYESGINFYREKNHLDWLNIALRTKERKLSDEYYFLSPTELEKLDLNSIEILKTYPTTGSVLAIPKNGWKHPRICVQQQLTFEKEPEQRYFIDSEKEYCNTITYIVPDSMAAHKHNVVVLEALVMATDAEKSDVKLVISLESAQGGTTSWSGVSMLDYIDKPGEWKKGILTTALPEDIKAGDKLLMYFWNPDKQEIYAKELRFKWLRYD
jgi:hypothetical protein